MAITNPEKSIKVAYIVSTLKRSGPTRQLLNIINGLDRSCFSPYVLTLSPEPDDSMKHEFETLSIPVFSLGLGRVMGAILARRQLSAWLKTIGPDIVHTQGIRADTLVSTLPYPHLITIRNYPYLDYSMTYGNLLGKLMAELHISVLRKTEQVMAVSNAVSKQLLQHDVKSDIILNGVDTDYYCPVSDGEKKQIRNQLGLPTDSVIVVATGHIVERKNPDSTVKAVLNNKNWLLILVGDGILFGELSKRYAQHNNIRMVGRQISVLPWLHASDFFVSASRAEGLPNAALEAMACGLPCVLSDIVPHQELLTPEPDAGVLVNGEDPDSLYNGLAKLLQKRDIHAHAARSSAINNFSAKKMSAQYQKVYKTMINLY